MNDSDGKKMEKFFGVLWFRAIFGFVFVYVFGVHRSEQKERLGIASYTECGTMRFNGCDNRTNTKKRGHGTDKSNGNSNAKTKCNIFGLSIHLQMIRRRSLRFGSAASQLDWLRWESESIRTNHYSNDGCYFRFDDTRFITNRF